MHHDVRTDDSREMNQNVRYTTFCSLRVEHCSSNDALSYELCSTVEMAILLANRATVEGLFQ